MPGSLWLLSSITGLPAPAEPLRWELVPPTTPTVEAQGDAMPMADGPVGISSGGLRWELVPVDDRSASERGGPRPLPTTEPMAVPVETGQREEIPERDPGSIPILAAEAELAGEPEPEAEVEPAREIVWQPGPIAWEAVPEGEVINPEAALQASGTREAWDLPEPEKPDTPLTIRGLARGITVNGAPFPDVGQYVPHGFAHDPEYIVSTTFDWVSRTRTCVVPDDGNWTDCADAVAYIDFTPFKGENTSLGFQWAIQSLSGRNNGTDAFAGQSLGFRAAWNITPTTGIAFGGEHIVQLDDTTDLGRNFYLVLSQAVPLSTGDNPIMLVATGGIGSDFYGYRDNGFFETDCLSGNNISSDNFPEGEDCQWGPIGSASVVFGSRASVGFEWYGFGLGAGVSLRPINDVPLTLSFYVSDFLGNTPSYIADLCTDDPCEPRFYGRITMSF